LIARAEELQPYRFKSTSPCILVDRKPHTTPPVWGFCLFIPTILTQALKDIGTQVEDENACFEEAIPLGQGIV
jgi:hypothetical protein